LGDLEGLVFFDRDRARVGQPIAGRTVRPLEDLPRLGLKAVLVSSLAFQDEMVEHLKSLSMPETRIVCCYP
jgi:hypothetical protein